MPLYDFRCKECGLEFEVSRPLARATDPAFCPMDGTESERIFTMPGTFIRNSPGDVASSPSPAPQGSSWSHFGHSHGPGAGGHSHGGAG